MAAVICKYHQVIPPNLFLIALSLTFLPLLGLQLPALMDRLHQGPHSSLMALEAVLLLKFWR